MPGNSVSVDTGCWDDPRFLDEEQFAYDFSTFRAQVVLFTIDIQWLVQENIYRNFLYFMEKKT